MRFDCVIIGKA